MCDLIGPMFFKNHTDLPMIHPYCIVLASEKTVTSLKFSVSHKVMVLDLDLGLSLITVISHFITERIKLNS